VNAPEIPDANSQDAPGEEVSDEVSQVFYAGALARIPRFMIAVAVVATLGTGLRWNWKAALGLACGSLISYLNFIWLERVVSALGERAAASQKRQSSAGVVVRFVLRYALMALGAYGILTVSSGSAYGLMAGLFLPVAGILCEAGYETVVHFSGKPRTEA
jgi:hypothetical protein